MLPNPSRSSSQRNSPGLVCCLSILPLLLGCSVAASVETLTVVVFNVESSPVEETDPHKVGGDISQAIQRGTLPRADIWGFAEVGSPRAASILRRAVSTSGGRFKLLLGRSAVYSKLEDDRLAIAYDDARLELREVRELEYLRLGRGVNRAPLVAIFRLRRPGAEDFVFVMNHLRRTEAAERHEQARLLNAWVSELGLPVILAGDFNFDWSVNTGEYDAGYRELVRGELLQWVRPAELFSTKCGDSVVLDFVFVGGAAKRWKSASSVHFPGKEYCKKDPHGHSDHRPVSARFEIPVSDP